MNWLSKIDPTVVLTAVTAILGFFVHRKQTNDRSSILDAIKSALLTRVLQLVNDPDAETKARSVLEQAANELLARLSVKRTTTIDYAVHALVEWALSELHDRLLQRLNAAQDATNQLAAGAAGVAAAFTPPPPEARTVKPLGLDIQIIPADQPMPPPEVP